MVSSRYQIVKEIGSGGIGKVFQATDRLTGDNVALKVLLLDEVDHVERFKAEFLLLKKLHHPNIVRVYDFGFGSTSKPYFTMEYVEGQDWKTLLEPLDYSRFWRVILHVCATLDFLHSKRIVHGDLKPSNILISQAPGGELIPKFTDFGFAGLEKPEESAWWKGTLPYLAPEIIRGEKHGHQADLYSLGVLLYESIFGKKPFEEEELVELAKSHLEKEVVIPQDPSVPAGLEDLILKLLEKDPIDRYFSATEVLRELEKISGIDVPDHNSSLAESLITSGEFVGREDELAILREAFDQVSAQGNLLILLSGERGIGKTRLLEEFSAWGELEGAGVVCVSLEDATRVKSLQENISHLLETSRCPSILILEDLEAADGSSVEILSDLIRGAQDNKLLVCATITNDSTRSERDRRASETEEEVKSRFEDSVRQVRLAKLTEKEQKEMLCSMFAWKEKETKIAAAIREKTEGNPLLIEKLMGWLVDHQHIRRQNGLWRVEPGEIRKATVPGALAEDLAGRFDRLGPEELNLLHIASVLGLGFETGVLAQLSGLDAETFRQHMDNLLAERILVPSGTISDDRRIRFLNGFARDIVYEQIDGARRRSLHQAIACHLEQERASGVDEHLDQLADHCYQAQDKERTLRYALLAAQRAESLGKRDQAISHYLRVLELWDQSPSPPATPKEKLLLSLAEQYEADGLYEKSIRCLENALKLERQADASSQSAIPIFRRMARIYGKTTQHEKATQLLQEALQLTDPEDLPGEYAPVLIDLARERRTACEYDEAIDYLERAIGSLKTQELSKETGIAFNCMAGVYWSLGDYPQALENLSKSLDVFQEIGDVQQMAECHIAKGLLLRSKGLPHQALEDSQKALGLLEELSDPYRLSVLENNLGIIYMDLNRWDRALECFSKNAELKRQLSDLKGLALSYNNIGLIYLKKGLFGRSFEQLTSALQSFQQIRDRSGAALVYYNLADLHRCKEEYEKASRYLEKSLRTAREIGEESRLADCLLLSGKIHTEQADFAKASESLNRAASLFAKAKNGLGEAEAKLALGELCLRKDHLQQAEQHLRRVEPFTQSSGNQWLEGCFRMVSADLSKAQEDREGGLSKLLQAVGIFKELGARHRLGKAYLELGKIKLEMGRTKEGRAFVSEALGIFEKSSVEGKRKEAAMLLGQTEEMPHLERERVRTFYKLAEVLNSVWDTDELLAKALELVIELLNAERGAIILYSEREGNFEVKVSRGLEPETSQDAVAISRRVLTDVIKSDSPLIVDNAASNPQFARSESVVMYNILSILCVPLRTRNRLIGTVYLDHRSLPAVFSSEDVDFLKAFAGLIATAIEKSELYVKAHEEIFQLKGVLHQYYEYPHIVGKSAKMLEIFNLVEKVANSKTSVLVFGENGTGKELIAHLIHERSQRRDGPFIRVNCAALPESILESELFGIEEKTATGVGFRKGKFELADGGTIFLDEIGDMSLSVQAKVLRVLQEKEFERVGGQRPIRVDIRIISATNMDLQKRVQEGTFRIDLFYRLNPIVITVPPLRERKDDIPYLVDYFVNKFSEENDRPKVRITRKIIGALENHSWPGNVRELQHLIERATLLSEDGSFPEQLLPEEVHTDRELLDSDKGGKLQEVLDWLEKKMILDALERNGWNQLKAAKELGLNETTLRRRIKKHRIRKTGRI